MIGYGPIHWFSHDQPCVTEGTIGDRVKGSVAITGPSRPCVGAETGVVGSPLSLAVKVIFCFYLALGFSVAPCVGVSKGAVARITANPIIVTGIPAGS